MARKKTTPVAEAGQATQGAAQTGAAESSGAADGEGTQGDSGSTEGATQDQGQADQLQGSDAAAVGQPGQNSDAASEAPTHALTDPPTDGRQVYQVISPLELDGKPYAIGETVRLTEAEAQPLRPHTVAPSSED